jgi:hypothetical protein
MTEQLTLTRALEGSGTQNDAAQNIATEIIQMINHSTGKVGPRGVASSHCQGLRGGCHRTSAGRVDRYCDR